MDWDYDKVLVNNTFIKLVVIWVSSLGQSHARPALFGLVFWIGAQPVWIIAAVKYNIINVNHWSLVNNPNYGSVNYWSRSLVGSVLGLHAV